MNKIIQLEVPDESLTQLRELAKDAGLKGISDLINNAVTLYGWAVKQVKAGKEIYALPQHPEEDSAGMMLEMPAFEALRPVKN